MRITANQCCSGLRAAGWIRQKSTSRLRVMICTEACYLILRYTSSKVSPKVEGLELIVLHYFWLYQVPRYDRGITDQQNSVGTYASMAFV